MTWWQVALIVVGGVVYLGIGVRISYLIARHLDLLDYGPTVIPAGLTAVMWGVVLPFAPLLALGWLSLRLWR